MVVGVTDRGVTVALDTNLTEALIAEGFALRRFSSCKTMRKEAGFEVVDRIHVTVKTADEKPRRSSRRTRTRLNAACWRSTTLGDAPEGRMSATGASTAWTRR